MKMRPNQGYQRQARRSPGGHRASTKAGQEQKEERLKERQGEEGYDSAKMKEAMCVTSDAETLTPRSALLTIAATPVLLALDRSSFGNADICGCQPLLAPPTPRHHQCHHPPPKTGLRFQIASLLVIPWPRISVLRQLE